MKKIIVFILLASVSLGIKALPGFSITSDGILYYGNQKFNGTRDEAYELVKSNIPLPSNRNIMVMNLIGAQKYFVFVRYEVYGCWKNVTERSGCGLPVIQKSNEPRPEDFGSQKYDPYEVVWCDGQSVIIYP